MKKRYIGLPVRATAFFLGLSLLILTMSVSSAAAEGMPAMPNVDAKSAILMEASTGMILGEKNADEALPPASVTKIMTLLLVMEAIEAGTIKLDDIVIFA